MSENDKGGDPNNTEEDEVDTLSDEELEELDVVEKDAYLGQRTRAEKAEGANKTLKETLAKYEDADGNPIEQKPKGGKKPNEEGKEEVKGMTFSDVAKIQTEIKDLNSDELELLDLEAKNLGVEPETYIKSNSWKATLSAHRQDTVDKNKTPSASNRVVVHNNKSYNEIMNDPESSKEDKQKAYEGLMAHKNQS